jgi:superoxide dismutase, Cu-Zn family
VTEEALVRVHRLVVLAGAAVAVPVVVAAVPAASSPARPAGTPSAQQGGWSDGGSGAASAVRGAGGRVAVVGTFAPAAEASTAYSYDPALVPAGAGVAVGSLEAGHRTTLTVLAVSGLVPDRRYSAHVHTAACTADPAAAGPHYQHRKDPVTPSVDPRYANRRNEVWLVDDRDGATAWFSTDARGSAVVLVANPWQYGERRGGSVVVHAQPTATGDGVAGTAGPRIGCVTVAF